MRGRPLTPEGESLYAVFDAMAMAYRQHAYSLSTLSGNCGIDSGRTTFHWTETKPHVDATEGDVFTALHES